MPKKQYSFIALIIALLSLTITKAQSTDLARIEYLNIPFTKGENTVQRFRAFAQAPIPLDKEKNKLLIVGLDYRQLHLKFDKAIPFNTESIQTTRRMEASLGYVWRLKSNPNWRFGVKGGIRVQSNLERSLVSDDFIKIVQVFAMNDMRKAENSRPYRWIFGLLYATTPGRWYPLPLVNYHREINEHWNYTLGVPKMTLRHLFDKKNTLQAYASLDHFFSNIQNNIPAATVQAPKYNNDGENISMTNVNLGLGYEHYFTKHLMFYGFAGHTVYNSYRIRDNKRNKAYVIEDKNSFYFRTGIRLKI